MLPAEALYSVNVVECLLFLHVAGAAMCLITGYLKQLTMEHQYLLLPFLPMVTGNRVEVENKHSMKSLSMMIFGAPIYPSMFIY